VPREKKTSQAPLVSARPEGQPSSGLEPPRHAESIRVLRELFWEIAMSQYSEAFESLAQLVPRASVLEDPIDYDDSSVDDPLPNDPADYAFEVGLIEWCVKHRLCEATPPESSEYVDRDGHTHVIRDGPLANPWWTVQFARRFVLSRRVGGPVGFDLIRRLSSHDPVLIDAESHDVVGVYKGLPQEANPRARLLRWEKTLRVQPERVAWSVRRRMGRISSDKLAVECDMDAKAVRNALVRIDDLLDLPRLPPGRKSG